MWPQFVQTQGYPRNSPFPVNYPGPPWAIGNYVTRDLYVPENVALLGRMKNDREKNRATIENFIDRCDAEKKVVPEEKSALNIAEAKESLVRAFEALKNLEKLRDELSSDVEDSEWSRKWQQCEKIRADYCKSVEILQQPGDVLKELETRLNRRRKKRLYQTKKRTQWKLEKKLKSEKRARRHDEIDFWIREKREAIERDKQIDHLRKDADIVLADVRSKRNDAKKFLALLQELRNLRKVKVNVARARGEHLPLAGDQVFDNIIGKFINIHEFWKIICNKISKLSQSNESFFALELQTHFFYLSTTNRGPYSPHEFLVREIVPKAEFSLMST